MDLVKAAEKFAKEKLDPYVWQHSLRVRKIALKIAKSEGGDRKVIEIAALLHDIGYIKGFKNHVENGGPIAKKFLQSLGLNRKKTEKIVNSVLRHGADCPPKKIEEKIINDADALERIGALGIHRMDLSALENFHLPTHEAISFTRKVTMSSYENLKTKTAKKLAQPFFPFQKEFFKQFDKQLKV